MSLRPLFCLVSSGRLRQVLLYILIQNYEMFFNYEILSDLFSIALAAVLSKVVILMLIHC